MTKQDAPMLRSAPRLYLVTPEVADAGAFSPELQAALAAADVAAVLLRLQTADSHTLVGRVRTLAPIVQQRNVALVLDGHPDIVARTGADGAQLAGLAAFSAARDTLKPACIAGCAGLRTRHDAMLSGEQGADYVLFGERQGQGRRPAFAAVLERVAWWAELFEVPCVGYAETQAEIAPLAEAGADFVALDFVWTDARGVGKAVAEAAARLSRRELVA
jgi:thiamine-phosphate pyrophosphorylase